MSKKVKIITRKEAGKQTSQFIAPKKANLMLKDFSYTVPLNRNEKIVVNISFTLNPQRLELLLFDDEAVQ